MCLIKRTMLSPFPLQTAAEAPLPAACHLVSVRGSHGGALISGPAERGMKWEREIIAFRFPGALSKDHCFLSRLSHNQQTSLQPPRLIVLKAARSCGTTSRGGLMLTKTKELCVLWSSQRVRASLQQGSACTFLFSKTQTGRGECSHTARPTTCLSSI